MRILIYLYFAMYGRPLGKCVYLEDDRGVTLTELGDTRRTSGGKGG